MTKKVRIEDADTAGFKIVVQTWDKSYLEGTPDIMVSETPFYGPTDLRDFYITSSRYLVVKEVAA